MLKLSGSTVWEASTLPVYHGKQNHPILKEVSLSFLANVVKVGYFNLPTLTLRTRRKVS